MKKNKYNDFEIGVPDGWVDASNVILIGAEKEGYSPTIAVTREYLTRPVSASSYAKEKRVELETELRAQNYQVVEEGPMKVNKLDAYKRVHTWVLPQLDNTVKQIQIYIIKDTDAIVITCSDKEERFKTSMPTFMKVIDQFKFV